MSNTLLITIDSLRTDHVEYMENTTDALSILDIPCFSAATNTPASFQSIIGGQYPDEMGIADQTSFVEEFDEHAVGITTNHLLSPSYAYDKGFNHFNSPTTDDVGIKQRFSRFLTPGSRLHTIGVRVWNLLQQTSSVLFQQSISRDFRRAEEVINEFKRQTTEHEDWVGWLHFMEPHYPYNPDNGELDRADAKSLSSRVHSSGSASPEEESTLQRLYKQEVIEIDKHLHEIWKYIDDDTEVVMCSDHGELLGENNQWGHPDEIHEKLIDIPIGLKNISKPSGEVCSLVDIPSLLCGHDFAQGQLQRDIAYVSTSNQNAVASATHIATGEDVTRHSDGTCSVSEHKLRRKLGSFSSEGTDRMDGIEEDLRSLGYME